ncbi:MAG: eutC [Rhizobacter sp.]|nr:eutC [Rhizobacter sp.]
MPTGEVLRFGFAHAQARDAVHLPLDADRLATQFTEAGFATLRVESAAADRASYLLRPDLGRRLSERSATALDEASARSRREGCDLLLVVADGLSSLATSRHALPLAQAVRDQLPDGWTLGPVVIATQARVALGDDIGERLSARLVAVLIGERPGLSSPDSLGIYLTWAPRRGLTDAARNCISNVRPEGLPPAQAARKLMWLAGEATRRRLSGIELKDASDTAAVAQADVPPLLPPR